MIFHIAIHNCPFLILTFHILLSDGNSSETPKKKKTQNNTLYKILGLFTQLQLETTI